MLSNTPEKHHWNNLSDSNLEYNGLYTSRDDRNGRHGEVYFIVCCFSIINNKLQVHIQIL